MASNVLTLVVTVDNRGANRSIDGLNKSLSSIEREALKAGTGATRGFNAIEQGAVRAAASVRTSFGGLGQIIAGLGLAKLGQAAVGIAADFERARIGIKALIGDAQTASKLFNEIQAFALESPFEFGDLLIGAQRLIAFNVEAKDIVKTLQAVSATTGALGGDQGKFADLITALGQIRTATKLTGEELRQLRNIGVEGIALESLAKAYGKSVAEIKKAQEAGLIPGLQAADIIIKGLNQRFGVFNDELSKTTSVSFSNLIDSLKKFADVAVSPLLPDIKRIVDDARVALEGAGKAARENRQAIIDVAKALLYLAEAYVAVKLAAGLYGAAKAVLAFNAAVKATATISTVWYASQAGLTGALMGGEVALYGVARAAPFAGVALAGIWAGDVLIRHAQGNKNLDTTKENLKGVVAEYNKLNNLTPRTNSGFDLLAAVEKEFPTPKKDPTLTLGGGADAAIAAAKKVADAEKRTSEILLEAKLGEQVGLAAVIRKYELYRAELGISAKANRDLGEAVRLRLAQEAGQELRKNAAEVVKGIEDEGDARRKFYSDQFTEQRRVNEDLATLQINTLNDQLSIQEVQYAASRDRQLRAIGAFDAKNVADKIAVEARKAAIEEEYALKIFALRVNLLDQEAQREADLAEAVSRARGASAAEIAVQRDAILQAAAVRAQRLEIETQASVDDIKESAANRQAQIAIDENRRVFDDLKRSAEGVIDALISRDWKKLWQAALLTPLKEILSTQIAGLLSGFLGGSGARGSAGGGGLIGRLAGLSAVGAGGGFGSQGSPGGTPGFAGPVGSGSGGGIGGFGGIASNFSGGLSGLKSFIGFGGDSLALGGGRAVAKNAASFGQKLTALGKSDAALGAGIALGADGLRRGGKLGLAETTASGALIGFRFGGGLGAAIGAAIGFGVGTVRLFIKGAQDKIVEKTKSIYGITISKDFARDPLLGIIKQNFGGNIDVGIRSPQVRDLIELYSMSTGQSPNGGFAATLRPVGLVQSGGAIRQEASYLNGSALPTLMPSAGASAAAVPAVTVVLDPDATHDFWETQTLNTVAANPRAIQSASATAQRGNYDRRQSAARLLSPGLVTA